MIFKAKSTYEMRTPVTLLNPNASTKYNGVNRQTYPATGETIFVNWKSYGGTETTVNGVYSIIDTAVITTWYRADIKAKSRLVREDGAVYEVISEPDNIEMQNVFVQFKVQRVKGGV